jgi:formate hydrogenlyase subunit 6/NADH:ubiquinone oxidoreductase subunit I
MDAKVERDGSVVVDSFSIDLGRCFSCGACIDICAPASLTFSRKYELAAETEAGLIAVIRDKKAGSTVEAPRIRSYEVRR